MGSLCIMETIWCSEILVDSITIPFTTRVSVWLFPNRWPFSELKTTPSRPYGTLLGFGTQTYLFYEKIFDFDAAFILDIDNAFITAEKLDATLKLLEKTDIIRLRENEQAHAPHQLALNKNGLRAAGEHSYVSFCKRFLIIWNLAPIRWASDRKKHDDDQRIHDAPQDWMARHIQAETLSSPENNKRRTLLRWEQCHRQKSWYLSAL